MLDKLIETPMIPHASDSEEAFRHHKNFAVLGLPSEYGDQKEVQVKAAALVKEMDLQGKYDSGWEAVSLQHVDTDASEAVGGNEAIEPLVRYYAALAKSWGFTNRADLSVMIQSDKTNDNPNEVVHRDGVGATAMLAIQQGKQVRTIRFVYPIGRPGTIVYPELDHKGAVVDWRYEVIANPTAEKQRLSPHVIAAEGEEKKKVLEGSSAFQLMPGATLVFDMTNSPWHKAPSPTPNGAVMTVDIVETREI